MPCHVTVDFLSIYLMSTAHKSWQFAYIRTLVRLANESGSLTIIYMTKMLMFVVRSHECQVGKL